MKLSDWISLVCFIIALVIVWQFRQILLLVFAAVVIATALNAQVRRLVLVFKASHNQAVMITMGLVLLALALFLGLVLPLFVEQFQQLLELIPEGFNRFIGWLNQTLDNSPNWLPDGLSDLQLPGFSALLEQFGTIGSQFFGNFVTFFSVSVATLLQLLLLIVLTVMLLSDPSAYRKLLLRLFPSFYRQRADNILDKLEWILLCWLGGVSINSLFVATLSFVGLVLLKVPYPFANAMLAGLFNFVPNIGPALSAIFPIIVALSQSFGSAIAVIILYVIIQNLESYWFSPMMMQRKVSLLPAVTLIVQLFFARFFGPMGLILAIPLAVVCKTWIEEAWIIDVLEKHEREPAPLTPTEPTAPEPDTVRDAEFPL